MLLFVLKARDDREVRRRFRQTRSIWKEKQTNKQEEDEVRMKLKQKMKMKMEMTICLQNTE